MDWILVRDRLPKEKGFYIFQVGPGKHGKVHEYYFDGTNLRADIFDEEILFVAEKTIAWQPLPNKYLG